MEPVEPTRIDDWHMHVYYAPDTRDKAALLRQWVEDRFTVRMGRWHDVPVGPHPTAMYQIQFMPDQFPALVPFVMMNRQGLTVLLHPQSGRPRDDHTIHATWMGQVLPLKADTLPEVG